MRGGNPVPPPGVLARVQGVSVPSYYPAFIDVRGRTCVVIGGGGFAEEKVHKLRECGAMVQVISPDITEGIRALVDGENVAWLPRKFESGDLGGAFIAVAATGDDDANEMISKEARERNVLLNVVDVTHLCTFIAPAIARRAATSPSRSPPAAPARPLRESSGRSCPPPLCWNMPTWPHCCPSPAPSSSAGASGWSPTTGRPVSPGSCWPWCRRTGPRRPREGSCLTSWRATSPFPQTTRTPSAASLQTAPVANPLQPGRSG